MLKKLLVLSLMSIIVNIFALDVLGLYEITSNVTLNEDLNVLPGGIVQCYNGNYTLTVNGSINNQGTIQNHPTIGYALTVNCSGNLFNTGSITNNVFNMSGVAPQVIVTPSPTAPISASYFNIISPFSVLGASDLYFLNSRIIFPTGGILDMQNGFGLNLDNTYLDGGDILGKTGDTPASYLNMTNGSYINNSTCSNLSYTGTILIVDDVVATGNSVNNGEIKSWSNAHRTLTTQDNFDNSGIITNNPPYETYIESYGYFENNGIVNNTRITCYGDFTNNASITSQWLIFNGTDVPQNLITAAGYPITSYYTNCTNSYGIVAKSNLEFSGSWIHFNGNTLDLTEGYSISINGGYMNSTIVKGAGTVAKAVSNFTMSDDAYLQNSTLSDLILQGSIDFTQGNIFNGTVTNQATIRNHYSNDYTLTINGDFDNLGTITDNSSYNLAVDFKGPNFHNAGIINNQWLTFSGTGASQNISIASGHPLSSYYTNCTNVYGLIAKSNLEFSGSWVHFNANSLDLTEGFSISLSGGYMNQTRVYGDTTGKAVSVYSMSDGSYMQNTTLNQVTLDGEITVVDNANIFNGPITNLGIIQNHYGYFYTLTLNGDFYNEGTVKNATSYSLNINANGNIINNGIMSNSYLNFSGSSEQNISCLNGNYISSSYVNSSNTAGVNTVTDVVLRNSTIDFSNNFLNIGSGSTLSVVGGYMQNISLQGASEKSKALSNLSMKNSAYMLNTIVNQVDLQDTITVYGDANIFNGPLTNKGVIQNYYGYFYKLTLDGDFVNEGTIENASSWTLNLDVLGDVTNNGTWTNSLTNFNGDSDQYIIMQPGYEISSPNLYFKSEIVDAPYEWYYSDNPIEVTNPDFSGIDTDNLRWLVPIDLTYSGTFFCQTNAGPTRRIIISDGNFEAPVITNFVNDGSTVTIYWGLILGAIRYDIYSSNDPYAAPETWDYEGSHDNVPVKGGASIEWSEPAPGNTKKFYFVKAVY